MAQRTGALVFDERTDRYDIRFDLNTYYGGLHCGECFDVFVRGKWKPTRIEYGDNWYLVGIRAEDLNGLRVRMSAAYFLFASLQVVPGCGASRRQAALCGALPDRG